MDKNRNLVENAIWIEKYRPMDYKEFKGQKEIVKRVKNFVEKGNMPHLLFAGPAGIGKTTLSLIIARKLFGEEWRNNFLELNASDERGIDVIRVKVKNFARTKSIGNVPFKIIYLDECDALTKEAQQALRRTMENYTKTTRFILSCNYSSKIIDPIQSRCTMFRFKPLDKKEIFKLIDNISQSEKITVDEKAKDALFIVSRGDCRRLENVMQSCATMSSHIKEEDIFSIASIVKPKEIIGILEMALKNDFLNARRKLLDVMLNYSLSGTDIIKQIQSEIWKLGIDDTKKVELIDKCAEIEFRLVEGSDEYIQLESLLATFAVVGN